MIDLRASSRGISNVVDRPLSSELSNDPWIALLPSPPPFQPLASRFGDRRASSPRRVYVCKCALADGGISAIAHYASNCDVGRRNFRQARRTAANANGKQQSRRNEALRSRLLQIARAIISVVTLPSSVAARRKFPRFGFRTFTYSPVEVSLENVTLSREIETDRLFR